MGHWGIGLYQNDTAADVKTVFGDLLRRPIDIDTLMARLREAVDFSDPDAEADAWLALADLLHQYALDHPATMARARRLIEDGADLAVKRDLGMSERDLQKREAVLGQALTRWSVPHPKPKKRRMPAGPELFVLEVGEVWAFPSMGHAARPFHVKDVDLSGFVPDGWGAFAVADRWHLHEYRACYLFILAHLAGPDRPTLAEVRAAPVLHCTYTIDGYDRVWAYPMVLEARLSRKKQTLKQWQAEKLGTLPFDAVRTRAVWEARPRKSYNASDPDGVAWLENDLTEYGYHRAKADARAGVHWHFMPDDTLRLEDFASAP